MVVFMVMRMAVGGGGFLLLAVDGHRHVGARNAAGGGGAGLRRHPRQAQVVHPGHKGGAGVRVQQFVQGGHQHIAGGAHVAFKIQRFHRRSVPPSG